MTRIKRSQIKTTLLEIVLVAICLLVLYALIGKLFGILQPEKDLATKTNYYQLVDAVGRLEDGGTFTLPLYIKDDPPIGGDGFFIVGFAQGQQSLSDSCDVDGIDTPFFKPSACGSSGNGCLCLCVNPKGSTTQCSEPLCTTQFGDGALASERTASYSFIGDRVLGCSSAIVPGKSSPQRIQLTRNGNTIALGVVFDAGNAKPEEPEDTGLPAFPSPGPTRLT